MSVGLEEMLIEQLIPKMEKIVDEYASSDDTLQRLHEGLEDLTRERVEELLEEEDIRDHMLKNLRTAIRDVVNEDIEKIGINLRTVEVYTNDVKISSNMDVYHHQYEDVLKIVRLRIPLLLTGPAGSGKNVIVTQVAKALNLKLYRCTSPQDKLEFEGFIDANGNYKQSSFYQAFLNGGLFLLDEMDNATANALIAVNDAISNGAYEFPIGEVKMHENFYVIATANTWGNGRSFEYVGRNKLDLATLDRFAGKRISYDKDIESLLYPDNEILEVYWKLRDSTEQGNCRAIFSMRGIKYAYILRQNGYDDEKIIKDIVIKGITVDDLNVLLNGVDIDPYDNMFYRALLDVRDSME